MKLGAIALGLLGFFHASIVHADDYDFSRVVLARDGCSGVGFPDADLRAALASELSASSLSLTPIGQASTSTDIVVSVREPCATEEDLVLIATWNGTRFERIVKLDELPRASRARALALVIAELVARFAKPDLAEDNAPRSPSDAASVAPPPQPTQPTTTEAVNQPEAPPAPSKPKAAKPKSPNAEARRPAAAPRSNQHESENDAVQDGASATIRSGRSKSRTQLGAALELRSFFAGPSLFGGRLRLDWDLFSLGLSAVGGDRTVPAGVLSAFIVHGTGAIRAVTLDTSTHTSLAMGPRIGLGYVTVTAQATSPGVETRPDHEPYVDGAAFVAFAFQPASSVRFSIGAELGYARGVIARSDATDAGHYGGMFASALFELAFRL